MPDHYTPSDHFRLLPIRERVKTAMLEAGWKDLDDVAKELGERSGTVASKLRELCDGKHAFLGLAYERRRVSGGKHEYRLFVREPEQLPLLDAIA